ncbi:MAG: ABC transporter permease [Gordonia sp. (in: high G+C Gram-positive bacteria)]|uniref:ABC transporter permease n=1 Tax=Gordonia sp. (in: high G+C Gram-positive bacteria) TaxID=84139 RepID=UPI0039E58B13
MSAPGIGRVGIDPTRAGVSFGRTLAVEIRKLFDTRAPLWLLGVMLLGWAAVSLVMVAGSATPAFETLVDVLATISRAFVGILAILLVTGEWGQRAVVTTFTLEPRRERVVAAKLVAVVAFAMAVTVVVVVLAALLTAVRGGDFGDTGRIVGAVFVADAFDVLMAVGFGLLFLNTAGAIAAYFVLPETVVPLLLLAGQGHLDGLGDWLYPRTVLSRLADVGGAGSWAKLLVCAVVWIGIPMLIGIYRVMTREVK